MKTVLFNQQTFIGVINNAIFNEVFLSWLCYESKHYMNMSEPSQFYAKMFFIG